MSRRDLPPLGEVVTVRLCAGLEGDNFGTSWGPGSLVTGTHIGLGLCVHRHPHYPHLWRVSDVLTGLAVTSQSLESRREVVGAAWARAFAVERDSGRSLDWWRARNADVCAGCGRVSV